MGYFAGLAPPGGEQAKRLKNDTRPLGATMHVCGTALTTCRDMLAHVLYNHSFAG